MIKFFNDSFVKQQNIPLIKDKIFICKSLTNDTDLS